VLNHTSGLHNALADLTGENAMLMTDWDECLKRIAMSEPETAPGQEQLYHYLSFGWLCGGIIEHASGKKFQEILEEAIVRPLNIEGELYVGIPPGVESRLANLTPDTDDLNKFTETIGNLSYLPSSFQPATIVQLANTLPMLFNMLNTRRAIVPAANGHCSARALARYYAALADGGMVPPPHSSSSKPPLGSHPHIPKFSSEKSPTKQKIRGVKDFATVLKKKNIKRERDQACSSGDSCCSILVDEASSDSSLNGSTSNGDRQQTNEVIRIFGNPYIHEAFMGVGEFEHLALPNGKFGLGFKRVSAQNGSIIGFGHSGMGGSNGFCDINNRFAIAVTLNKISMGGVTGKIVNFVCSELNIPVPEEYARFAGPEQDSNFAMPLIN
jgi:aarF domain-containing kinase